MLIVILAKFIDHTTFIDDVFLTDIGTVSIKKRARIIFFVHDVQCLSIIVTGMSHCVAVDHFGVFIDPKRVFVAIETGVIFLHPPSIYIFLAKLAWLLFPGLRQPVYFDRRVFFSAVSLTRYINNTCIDYLSIFSYGELAAVVRN
jgi:hypothetical protein